MHRFYIDPSQSQEKILHLSERESHHGLRVLRVRAGERAVTLDGAGTEYMCEVHETKQDLLTLKVLQKHMSTRPSYQITLLQAIPKGKMMESIVQKATELGVHRIIPLLADRSVIQLEEESAAAKVEKWQTTAIESIKQCGSAWLPQIETPISVGTYLARGERPDLPLIATLQPDAQHPRKFFREFIEERKRLPVTSSVWVGPEGDFTPAEISAIRSSGALPITLGPLILRSETAAFYCLSILNYELQASEIGGK
jgi:16S rRNA (uracil1498-N3)-methyltransferase